MSKDEIVVFSGTATQTIISTEVAEMLETRHDSLLRKIEGINNDLVDHNFVVNEFWLESQYVASNGKSNRCYNITKKGCEFLAHKTTGTKGNIFTARYMERFEQMEKALKARAEPPKQELSDMEILSRAVLISNTKIQELEGQVEELKPKAEFADYFLSKPGDISVDELAQILCSNGLINFGYIKLFQWLRDNKYVKKSYGDNVPTQRSLNLKIMRVAERTYEVEGVTFIKKQTRITPKGVEYFIKKFKEDKKMLDLKMINKEVLDIESETLVNIITRNGEPIVKKYSRLDYSNEFVAHVVNKLRDDGYEVELVDSIELIVRRREK